jgi:hypothetical protein
VTCTCPDNAGGRCVGGGCPTSPPPASSPMYCYGDSSGGDCVGAATGPGCWPPH